MGVWKRIKSWIPTLKERVEKVGVWKRLDLALLKRTERKKKQEEEEESEEEQRKRKDDDGS